VASARWLVPSVWCKTVEPLSIVTPLRRLVTAQEQHEHL